MTLWCKSKVKFFYPEKTNSHLKILGTRKETCSKFHTKEPQKLGRRGGAIDGGTALKAGRSRFRFPMVLVFQLHNPSDHTMAPVADSVSKIDEHREYFLESKGSRYLGLTTFQPSRADYL
jgi:hypothetical protein